MGIGHSIVNDGYSNAATFGKGECMLRLSDFNDDLDAVAEDVHIETQHITAKKCQAKLKERVKNE